MLTLNMQRRIHGRLNISGGMTTPSCIGIFLRFQALARYKQFLWLCVSRCVAGPLAVAGDKRMAALLRVSEDF